MNRHIFNQIMREPELHISGDDIADVLVGILSQTGFKVMQKCNNHTDINFWYAMAAP